MAKRFQGFFITCIFLFLLLGFGPGGAAGSETGSGTGKVVWVVIDRISWEDLQKSDLPQFRELISTGAAGLMTTNPAGGAARTPDNTFATLGAGAKISGGISGRAGFNVSEPYEYDSAGQAFFRRTGVKPETVQVVHLGIAQMENSNLNLKYGYVCGAIGTILHQNGLRTAVIGNADVPGTEKKYSRQVVSLAMDKIGMVDLGDVSSKTYRSAPDSLTRVKTNFPYLLLEFQNVAKSADFIVIDTGDTARIDEMRGLATDQVVEAQKTEALQNIDQFLAELRKRMDPAKDLLMIVVPCPSKTALEQYEWLTPFIMSGPGVAQGLVWSGTVKRNGLISNTDLAVTTLNHFHLPSVVIGTPEGEKTVLSGQVIQSRPSSDVGAEVARLADETSFLHVSRSPLVRGYLDLALAVIILGPGLIWLRTKFMHPLIPILGVVAVMPGVMLWGRFFPGPATTAIVSIFAGAVVLSLALWLLNKREPARFYLIVTGLTLTMLAVDLLAGSPLGKTSPFSYDALAGARFYGIGNEYMGILIGSTLVFTALLLDYFKKGETWLKALVVVLYLFITFMIAAPNYGTNVGGFLSAMAGFGAAVFILFRTKITKGYVFLSLLLLGAVVCGFIAFDLTRDPESQSHIGRTAALIAQSGFGELINIISRKWAVNIKLIRYSTWSWVYLISILGVLVTRRMASEAAAQVAEKYPWFVQLLTATLVGSLAALFFNDSGVVAAANTVIFATTAYLTLVMTMIRKEEETK